MSKDSNIELLLELSSLDEVTARIPTDQEGRSGLLPDWCELVLELNRVDGDFPLDVRLPLRRHDGELIIEVIHSVLHPYAGSPVVVSMWEDLDEVVDRLQDRIGRGKDPLKHDVGEALGLARCIARTYNPYEPDVDGIRVAAMERYAVRTGLQEEEE